MIAKYGIFESSLPDSLNELRIHPKYDLTEEEKVALDHNLRMANYLAAAMIFLESNTLLKEPLEQKSIRSRLLGHWGTCPGLTLMYSCASLLIKKNDLNMIFVTGPGHGAPAILAHLFLEGSLTKFYPKYSVDDKGAEELLGAFSTPRGFPSHISAEVPGSIHEGGELGYALAVAWGSVMDSPDLITTVVVGDGESESGPTAAAWHSHKYIDPAESGGVIPIVHLNGFKISEKTIYGTMDDKELTSLFTGMGYKVAIVATSDKINEELYAAMQWALETIKEIQKAARSGKPIEKARWPVILCRTPKGHGCPEFLGETPLAGSFHSHQVPVPKAKSDAEQFKLLIEWLEHYKHKELWDNGPKPDTVSIYPSTDKRMGIRPETYANYKALKLSDWKALGVEKGKQESCMIKVGQYLDKVCLDNPHSLRIFSPDELESNKLNAVFDHTNRNFQDDPDTFAKGGRVIEILSEHCCQGWLQGYTLTGRTAVFPSYESFLGIIHTMMVQFAKFAKMSKETNWRESVASVNYIETSTWAFQMHNGFSHQNPSFIGAVLTLKADQVRVYLPPDANCFLSTIEHCLQSKSYINLMVGAKQPSPTWLTPEEADLHCKAGASVWKFASTDEGLNPDIVLVGIGNEITFEVISAAAMLRKDCPALRVRVVNVTDLMVLQCHGAHPHALTDEAFDALFTADKHIHFNYHGYAIELQGLLFGRRGIDRVSIEGYREEGSTTTPFMMMVENNTSRYHVASEALRFCKKQEVGIHANELIAKYQHEMREAQDYAYKYSDDHPDCYATPTF